jgi:hypothetical protein
MSSSCTKAPDRKIQTTQIARGRRPLQLGSLLTVRSSFRINNAITVTAARRLICSYFINHVYEQCEAYARMATPEMREKTAKFPDHYIAAPFPWLSLLVLLPCAVLAGIGVRVRISAMLLMVEITRGTVALLWQQM